MTEEDPYDSCVGITPLEQRDVSDDKPKWDTPGNEGSSKPDEAGELARKHGLSPDRAQMLIDRYGHDPERLNAAAEKLQPKGRKPPGDVGM